MHEPHVAARPNRLAVLALALSVLTLALVSPAQATTPPPPTPTPSTSSTCDPYQTDTVSAGVIACPEVVLLNALTEGTTEGDFLADVEVQAVDTAYLNALESYLQAGSGTCDAEAVGGE